MFLECFVHSCNLFPGLQGGFRSDPGRLQDNIKEATKFVPEENGVKSSRRNAVRLGEPLLGLVARPLACSIPLYPEGATRPPLQAIVGLSSLGLVIPGGLRCASVRGRTRFVLTLGSIAPKRALKVRTDK